MAKNTKRILAVFVKERIIFDYTAMKEKFGVSEFGYINCEGKCRIYGTSGGVSSVRYDVQTVTKHPGGCINGYVEIEYTESGSDDWKSMCSDILIEDEKEAFWMDGGCSNTKIYDNE